MAVDWFIFSPFSHVVGYLFVRYSFYSLGPKSEPISEATAKAHGWFEKVRAVLVRLSVSVPSASFRAGSSTALRSAQDDELFVGVEENGQQQEQKQVPACGEG